jgi:uronate dehydrogenase
LVADHPAEEVVLCDLADADGVASLCAGVDTIIHMGGRPGDGPWQELLQTNIVNTMNLFDGARRAGVGRVLYASSNHVVGMYPAGRRLEVTSPLRPDSLYALTKAFGEDTAAYYAYKYGIRGFCMRIGSFTERPKNRRALSTWCSHGDLMRLVEVGLTADYAHAVVYGVSNNSRSWWDNSPATALGYRPLDNAEDYAAEVEHIVPEDAIERDLQGADRSSDDFRGNHDWLQRL